MAKLRELLLTAAFVALVVIGLRALEAYSSRPLIYLEGTFATYIADEGWMYVVRYTVGGVPAQMFASSEARAVRFIAYLRRVGVVINDSSKVKDVKSPTSASGVVDKEP